MLLLCCLLQMCQEAYSSHACSWLLNHSVWLADTEQHVENTPAGNLLVRRYADMLKATHNAIQHATYRPTML